MRHLLLGLLLTAGIVASALQPAVAEGPGKRIAFSATSTKQPFVATLARTLQTEAAARDMTVTVLTAGYDSAAQAQQISDAIAQKYDAIAVLAIDQHAIVPTLVRAKAAGIPIVLVNSPIEPGHDDLYVTLVAENKVDLGRMGAEAVLKAATDRKTVKTAIISGTLTESTPELQIAGFKEVAAKNPKLKIMAIEDAHWDMAKSEQIAGQLFARFAAQGGLDAIFTMVDNMADGAIQAARTADIPLGTADHKLILVSSGCMKFGLDPIRKGEQYATMAVLPTRTGKVTAQVLADYFKGKSLPKRTLLPVEEITKANVEQYAKACTY
ncbi:MAG: sugar ABC transporter substrate-binding protein [Rhizomicrobium sp.]